jgi:CRISPR/Cas system-associated endonuclease Cas1
MDLVEPLRPLADRFSARLLKSELAPDDFQTEGDSLPAARRAAWNRLQGLGAAACGQHRLARRKDSWRRLIHLQARELAHWLDGSTAAPRFWHLDDA